MWLIVVGTVYAAWSLLEVRSSVATSLLAAISIVGAGLMLFGIAMTRAVARLPFLPANSDSYAQGRRLMRRFGMIFAAEAVAIAVVSVVCMHTHHWRFIVPLVLIIVGLHFLPLAKLFAVPRYYVTGGLFCVISIATMLAVPAHAHIGQSLSWITIPSVGCGVVSLVAAWAGLDEVQRFLESFREQL
jgi:uncharacterized membrane protein YvlD (DUF360 family)